MKSIAFALLICCSLAQATPSVRLVFVGDIMLDDGPGKTIAAGGDPLTAFDSLLRGADFRIGNLECPVALSGTELESKIETFRADPTTMRVLQGRFTAVSVANNHSGDFGPEAFLETLQHVRAAGIVPFGGGRNLSEAHAPLWLAKHGLRIAVLAYDEYKPRRFEAGVDSPGVAWSEDSHVVNDIRAARAAGADIVIPFMHWGWENERRPTPRQWHLARLMIDAGADAVVGAHPHVTQGADLYRGKPIVWSLGNFVFDGFGPGPGRVGWWLEMGVDRLGVSAWSVAQVNIDAAGTPTPAASAAESMATLPLPCGRRGDTAPRLCPAAGH